MIIKHLYQRTITKNQKKIKVWYYWYKDNNGKVIRRSCGQSKKPCLIKRDALAFIASLNDEDLIQDNSKITIGKIATGMFDDDSNFLIKEKNKGIKYAKETITNYKKLLNNYLLPRWSNYDPNDITVSMIENWLLEFDKGAGWKNYIIALFKKIYKEAFSNDYVKVIPQFQNFKRDNYSHKDILTQDDINILFPDNIEDLISVWKIPHHTSYHSLVFGLIYYITLTCGLRSGEVRAIQLDQIQDNCLIINKMINKEGKIINHLKKGDDINTRSRVVIIPDKAKRFLDYYLSVRQGITNFVFEFHGKPISGNTFVNVFKKVTDERLDVNGRYLTPHSLRFTCNSLLRHHIPDDLLQMMIGHTSTTMTDYYDKSDEEMKKNIILLQNSNVNEVWK